MLTTNEFTNPNTVLLIDDDDLFADIAAETLRARGYVVEVAYSLRDAQRHSPHRFDWVVVDHKLPDGSGLALASEVGQRTKVLVISADPGVESQIDNTKLPGSTFLAKPFHLDTLVRTLGARTSRGPSDRSTGVKETSAPAMVSTAAGARPQREFLAALARSRCAVLVTGETGSGKGHFAHMLQAMSIAASRVPRAASVGRSSATNKPLADQPFVSVNCAAIPASLMESELFGVERGAFTGAEARPGLLELANGGTLFLDEIGELPPAMQAKLLTFLDDGRVRRVGGTSVAIVNVRVVAATNKDLDRASAAGEFRSDLLHRLDVARIELTPLRDRRADLPDIVVLILERLSKRDGLTYSLAQGETERLKRHSWPGNIRELENTIERSILSGSPSALTPSVCIRSAPLPTPCIEVARSTDLIESSGDLTLESALRKHVLRVLELCDGNRTLAAAKLEIGLSTLRRKVNEWGGS